MNTIKEIIYLILFLTLFDLVDATDGSWSQWSNYTKCSETGGRNAKQMRTRTCSNPVPSLGGKNCSGSNIDYRNCNSTSCDLEGIWSEWSNYSKCAASCNADSTQFRIRNCTNRLQGSRCNNCKGSQSEYRICNLTTCAINYIWSEWSNYSKCIATCGTNITQVRHRNCTNPRLSSRGKNCDGSQLDYKICNLTSCAIDGFWTAWSNYSRCNGSCGSDAVMVRTRNCTNPPASNGGKNCSGSQLDYVNCNLTACSIDGSWSEWSNFSKCNATCGTNALQSRTRNCTNPSPSNGGKSCNGSYVEYRNCNLSSCDNKICNEEEHGCEHVCSYNAHGKAVCFCFNGYIIKSDNKTCEDINECLLPDNKCDGLCINYEGSYMCLCRNRQTFWDVENLICATNDDD